MSMASPVRHAPLVIQVSEQFRALIESGAWRVGERIPGENHLAQELGVSRGTVREALRALSLTGLLEPRVGDGTYVRATDELAAVLMRDDSATALDQVLDVRAALEALGARLAAQHRTSRPLASIRAALSARKQADAAGDLQAYVAADAAFHRAVVEAGGNPLLLRLYDAIAATLVQSIHDTSSLPEDPHLTDAHAALLSAIETGDADVADRAARALIETVKATNANREHGTAPPE